MKKVNAWNPVEEAGRNHELEHGTSSHKKKGYQNGSKQDGFFAYWKIGGGQKYTTSKKGHI